LNLGLCLIALSLFSAVTLAQDITSGAIQGVVSDEQGAVVPGALVEAKNLDTNFTRTFTTTPTGVLFSYLSRPAGTL
jgi:hypothetical protein